MTYAAEVLVYHSHVLTLRGFWRQHFNYGRGACRFHQIRARRDRTRVKLEPLSFYLNLLRRPFSQPSGRRAFLLASLLMMSQALNAGGYLWERMKPSEREPTR